MMLDPITWYAVAGFCVFVFMELVANHHGGEIHFRRFIVHILFALFWPISLVAIAICIFFGVREAWRG